MPNALVLNCTSHEVRVAMLEDEQVVEIYVERRQEASLVGNIYKGCVRRVVPGMQAAFVDIGLERAAFLYVSDAPRPEGAEGEARGRLIQDILHKGQEIVVQVSKDPMGTKGARVTGNVSIAGRHLVYMPTVTYVGVSRRIVDDEERRRLREILETLVPSGGGFVARTAAEGRSIEELQADLEYLRTQWGDLLTRKESMTAPAPLYEDLDLVLRTARDLVTPDLARIIVDDEDEYRRLERFMRRFMPRYVDRVVHYQEEEPVFDAYGVEIEIQRALGRKVWLPSGGYLIIDQTEALTAIDVNTGRYVGKRNLEDTITRTNLEAVQEIVHQLRLRNLGGIIIIDFIDMERDENQNRVFSSLATALEQDRAKSNITKISDLGLVEMTRKRVRESLLRSLTETCFYCEGSGHLKSRISIAHEIYRTLLREAPLIEEEVVRIDVHPRVADLLQTSEAKLFEELALRVNKRLVLQVRADFHLEHFEFGAVSWGAQMIVGPHGPHSVTQPPSAGDPVADPE